jgi:branched-chain amino acid transport system permease protein
VISFGIAVVISAGVYLFLKLSRLGKAIRATALNAEVALVCGIPVRRVYLITTGLAAALAVAGGRSCRSSSGSIPRRGWCTRCRPSPSSSSAAGATTWASLIGGVMLAVLEGLVSLLVPNGTAMVELAAYTLMIFVLLIRPGGLMGVKDA